MPTSLPIRARAHRPSRGLVVAAALCLLTALFVAAPPARAQLTAEPPVALDPIRDDFAEMTQERPLLARFGELVLVVYEDHRDDLVHVALTGGGGATEGFAAASRRSVALPVGVRLADADWVGGDGVFLLVYADAGTISAVRVRVGVDPTELTVEDPVVLIEGGFSHPRAAWGPGEFAVVFRGGTGETGPIRKARVGAAFGEEVSLSNLVASAGDFDIAGTGGRDYLLTWTTTTAEPLVRAGAVNASLFLDPTRTYDVAPVDAGTAPRAAVSASAAWVAWRDGSQRLTARSLDADYEPQETALPISAIGATVGEFALDVGASSAWFVWTSAGEAFARFWGGEGLDEALPMAAEGASGAAVVTSATGRTTAVYRQERDLGGDIVARILQRSAAEAEVPVTVGSAPRPEGAVVWTGELYLVAWTAPDERDDHDVYLAALDADGLPVAAPVVVAAEDTDEREVALAVQGANVLVTWVADGTDLMARVLSAADPYDEPPLTLCQQPAGLGSPAATGISAASADFMLVWEDLRNAASDGSDVVALALNAASPAAGCGAVVAGGAGDQHQPRIGPRGAAVLVSWLSEGAETSLFSRAVDANLNAGALRTLIVGGDRVVETSLAAGAGSNWGLAVAREAAAGGTYLEYLLLAPNGSLTASTAFGPAPGALQGPRLALRGGDGAVFWTEGPGGALRSQAITAMTPSGEPRDIATGLLGVPLGVTLAGDAAEAGLLTREPDPAAARDDERLLFRRVFEGERAVAVAGGPYSGLEGDSIRLEGDGSLPLGGLEVYEWTVAGDVTEGSSVDQTFADDGNFEAVLFVSDDETGTSDRARVEIFIANVPPSLDASASTTSPDEGVEVTFTADWADPGVDDEVTLSWDFDDGTVVGGAAADFAEVAHAFATGDYTVCVTAADKDGGRAEDCLTVRARNAAPRVDLAPAGPIAEGNELTITADVSDTGGDTLKYEWTFGDGATLTQLDVAAPYPASVVHVYADDRPTTGAASPYQVCLKVTDDDGLSATDCISVSVVNVPPAFIGDPPTQVVIGVDGEGARITYAAAVTIVDPGDTALTYGLTTGGLPGVTFTPPTGPGEATVQFEPTLADYRRNAAHRFDFVLTANDGDPGGVRSLAWSVELVLQDEDDDGLHDDCERLYPALADAVGSDDSDGDGLDNATECVEETDPTQDDRPPSAPTVNAPADGAVVDVLRPQLSVNNVAAVEGVSYEYEFELYSGVELFEEQLVFTALVDEGAGGITQVQTSVLADLSTFYWRARVVDRIFEGPWSDVAAFDVRLPNEAPSAPVPVSPEGDVADDTPTFEWQNSTDADGDGITYELALYADEGLSDRVRLYEGIVQGGTGVTRFTIGDEDVLVDNTFYWWQVIAHDVRGLDSEPSEAVEILVNFANDRPGQPVIVSPEDGGEVTSRLPTLVVEPTDDLDGDELLYQFVVSADETFDNIVASTRSALPDTSDGLVRYTLTRELDENRLYHWRAAAFDGNDRGLGPFVQATFTVNATNDPPPAPTVQSPAQNQSFAEGLEIHLRVRNVDDPDGQALTYEFEVDDAPTYETLVFAVDGVEEGEGDETEVLLEAELTVGTTYYLRARAVDSLRLAGEWSREVRFQVIEARPRLDPPEPVSPDDEAVVTSDELELVVQNPALDDAEGRTTEFAIYADAELEDEVYSALDVVEDEEGVASHVVADPLPNGLYYWNARVRLGDEVSGYGTTRSFTLDRDEVVGDGDGDMGADVDGDTGGGGGDAGGDGGFAEAPDPETGCCRTAGGARRSMAGDGPWLFALGLLVAGSARRRRQRGA
jgi:hypothetical protein